MTQVSKYRIDKNIYNEIFDTFLQIIINITSKSEATNFFENFLTKNEKIMFAKRLAVGILVARGLSQRQIMETLKVSSATVSNFTNHYKYSKDYESFINKILLNKKIDNLLISIGEKLTKLGTYGRKGTGLWKELNKSYINSKSKLVQ